MGWGTPLATEARVRGGHWSSECGRVTENGGLGGVGLLPERRGMRKAGVEVYSRDRFILTTGDVYQAGNLVSMSTHYADARLEDPGLTSTKPKRGRGYSR